MVAIKQFPDRASLQQSLNVHSQLNAAYTLKLEACVRDIGAAYYAAVYEYSPRDSVCAGMLEPRCGLGERMCQQQCSARVRSGPPSAFFCLRTSS